MESFGANAPTEVRNRDPSITWLTGARTWDLSLFVQIFTSEFKPSLIGQIRKPKTDGSRVRALVRAIDLYKKGPGLESKNHGPLSYEANASGLEYPTLSLLVLRQGMEP
ncbi:hypothetical protein DPMN_044940 [Dreissena polymorpha]|uniref:Uncharacterized protein n=1 Tax=Dreissena polymorpha TaxID=45954 RepID=A0A9D4HZE5_DREPO|nr:hypothetical protein DPMN_044940 [Dreissena polymorpha]